MRGSDPGSQSRQSCRETVSPVPAVGAVEVAIVGVVVAVGVDQLTVHRAAAPVAENPGRLLPERPGRKVLDLAGQEQEFPVGGLVVRLGQDEVVVDQFCDVGNGVGHDCESFPFSVRWVRQA